MGGWSNVRNTIKSVSALGSIAQALRKRRKSNIMNNFTSGAYDEFDQLFGHVQRIPEGRRLLILQLRAICKIYVNRRDWLINHRDKNRNTVPKNNLQMFYSRIQRVLKGEFSWGNLQDAAVEEGLVEHLDEQEIWDTVAA
eukprot:CAMPEP_0182890894 /NCGR_PEP_ID=MMETSP0034_2-20130328/22934_1 /TAXON_ID=156128 /ORGANISM="Nephroselmis pyriformis, Strain CCMP717" /LENGTH=139 /DNA_ID=CAMNT_0025024479 /DNA_START=223 /DNA_END=638 /DNA_ORIENTATION=-